MQQHQDQNNSGARAGKITSIAFPVITIDKGNGVTEKVTVPADFATKYPNAAPGAYLVQRSNGEMALSTADEYEANHTRNNEDGDRTNRDGQRKPLTPKN